MIPNEFFDFDPPPARAHLSTAVLGGRCGGGGSKLLCVLRLLCVDSHTGPEEFFSSLWTP